MRGRIAAVWLVLVMLSGLSMAEAPVEVAPSDVQPVAEAVDGSIRVLLQSLGQPVALGITLESPYSVNGDRGFQFDPGTEIALGINGENIALKVGGATIDMGRSFSLIRHLNADEQASGAYIHESQFHTLYRGDLAFEARNGAIRAIVTLDIEEYLYGVVPYEMSNSFPMEALKAQAVAARTYAMQRKTRNTGDAYDVEDTANSQVYKGYNARYAHAIQAVDETNGIVGMYGGAYAECLYTASNGGQTALASDVWGREGYPYLALRDDPYDLDNPKSEVRTAVVRREGAAMEEALYTLLIDELVEQLQASGELSEGGAIAISEVEKVEAVDPVYGGESRQYGTVRFTLGISLRRYVADETQEGALVLGEPEEQAEPVVVELSFYDQVRGALGIAINGSKYDMLTVEDGGEDGFILTSRRFGHGVGLSQRGAEWMAKTHSMTYLDILHFYYAGLDFVRLTWMDKLLTQPDALPESLGYAAPLPTPAPTPAPLPPLQGSEYYATVIAEGSLNVREGPSTDHELVGVILNGARLIVTEALEDGWAKMKTAELEGYVLMTFIEKE